MNRPSLLLIHGFPLEGSNWREQLMALEPVARMLAPDLRGFGDDHRPLPMAMAMDTYAADLKSLLDDQGIDRVVICGLSMGGYIALSFIAQWPERVSGLVLCNTRATADSAEGKLAREQTAMDAHAHGAAVIARAMVPKVLSERTRREHPEIADRMEAMMARQRPEAIAAASLGMALRPDRMDLLPTIQVPTLIITGSEDQLMPLPTSEAMRAAIPGSRLVVIDGVAHLSNVEAPDLFNHELERFLDECG